MFSVAVWPAVTTTVLLIGLYPMSRTRSSTWRAGADVMRYSPRSLVTLPTVVPATNTWAPASGRPEPVSVTFPSTVPVACADPIVANARTKADAAKNMLFQRTLLMRPSHGDEVTADHKL